MTSDDATSAERLRAGQLRLSLVHRRLIGVLRGASVEDGRAHAHTAGADDQPGFRAGACATALRDRRRLAHPARRRHCSVFGGMIAATAIGVFVIPLLYIVFERARSRRWRSPPPEQA